MPRSLHSSQEDEGEVPGHGDQVEEDHEDGEGEEPGLEGLLALQQVHHGQL